MNFRCKIVEEIYFYLLENLAVVRLPLCDDVTTKDLLGKILNFKGCKKLELPLFIVFNTWSTI